MQNEAVRNLLLCSAVVAALALPMIAQNAEIVSQNSEAAARRVNEILSSAIKEGQITLNNNVKITQRVPPSNEALAEMKSLGIKAIPALVQHLDASDAREQELAIRFLGAIGGEAVVEPLGAVVLKSPYGTSRYAALAFLPRTSWNSIRMYVQHAATDNEPAVRNLAARIQVEHDRAKP